ncbi:MAG TPA: hypothetical protein VJT49_26250 [Amycolatopsis sp.]|uniref:hypothetical protein n=1 Tax=Amycolatopsis sp. TaxID=37632 RepID=UPI002B498020|nr:hypothetical protein [Amycolatopsis sp.]HKS48550.1 hypothetical protein [Amycolatopsis sp.]
MTIGFDADSGPVLWLFAAFVVTFVVTRVIVRLIRAGKGPFRDAAIGGVHVHHHVYGIFLILLAGLAEFVYRPGPPWVQVLAGVFGAGAALTLDEFALWLHLDDVYWTEEGRKSVDVVLAASLVGLLLVLGARPFDDAAGEGRIAFAVTAAVNLVFSVVAVLKGKSSSGVIGLVISLVAIVAAMRLAKPGSLWARKRYPSGSRKLERSRARFPPDRRSRWARVADRLAGAPVKKKAQR